MAIDSSAGPSDITHLIQLAIAPVFLLTAVGTTLNVLTNRLARIVDRGRSLQERASDQTAPVIRGELAILEARARLIYLAMCFGVLSALLVCLLIGTAFAGYVFQLLFAWAIAGLFLGAMVCYSAALIYLLLEVYQALRGFELTLPVPPAGPVP